MELLGPSAAGLCVLGIGICLYFVLAAGHIRIPDDPPDVDVELDLLFRRRYGHTATDTGPEAPTADTGPAPDGAGGPGQPAGPTPTLTSMPLAQAS